MAQEEPFAPEGSIEIGVGYTDNLNRDTDEISADIGRIAVQLAGSTDRRWFRATLASDIEYRSYNADAISVDDEILGSADALFELKFVPDRIQWDSRASYGQVRIDAFGGVGPLNRQRTTSFSTGPQIGLPLGQRNLLRAGGTVSDQSFEVTSELDGRTVAANLALERQLDPITRVSLKADWREIEYDVDSRVYETTAVSFDYRRELASGEAYASIGRGRVKTDNDQSDAVTVGQLVWRRAVGARSRIEVCAGREITDAGRAFEGAGVAVGCPGDFSTLASVVRTTENREQGTVPTTNPLVRAGGSLSLLVDGDQGSFRATVSLAEDRFEEDSTFDNDSTIFELAGSRIFARNWSAELIARLALQDFIDQVEENEDRVARLSISRLLARSFRLTLSAEHRRRVGGVGPYDANEYFLSIGRDFNR